MKVDIIGGVGTGVGMGVGVGLSVGLDKIGAIVFVGEGDG